MEAGPGLDEADRVTLLRPWSKAVGSAGDVFLAPSDRAPARPVTPTTTEPPPIADAGRGLGFAVILAGFIACVGSMAAQAVGGGVLLAVAVPGLSGAIAGVLVGRREVRSAAMLGVLYLGTIVGVAGTTVALVLMGVTNDPAGPFPAEDIALAVLFVGGWIAAVSLVVVGPAVSVGFGLGLLVGRRARGPAPTVSGR